MEMGKEMEGNGRKGKEREGKERDRKMEGFYQDVGPRKYISAG
jgi:hypothetical protein